VTPVPPHPCALEPTAASRVNLTFTAPHLPTRQPHSMANLQFAPWTSEVELAFYASLANLKINHDKLDDSARKVLGLYELRPLDAPERSCRLQIHGNALTTDEYAPSSQPYVVRPEALTASQGFLSTTIAQRAS